MPEPGKPLTLRPSRRRQLARWQKEQRRQRTALVVGATAVVLILALVAYGYVTTFVLPPRQVVVRVNQATFTLGEVVKILRMFQRGLEGSPQAANLGTAPFQVITTLADNELLRQAAPRYAIAVSDEDIHKEVRQRILGNPAGDPSALEREFRERYRQYLARVGLSEAEHRRLVLYDLYRERLREVVGREVPTVLPQVHLYSINLGGESAKYQEVKTELGRGTPFSQLVEKYSPDPEEVRKNGEVGWVPRGIFPDLDELLFEKLKPGELSEAVPQPDGTTRVYFVSEKAEAREVEARHREVLKTRALEKWLAEERKRNRVETYFDSQKYEWVIKQLRLTRARAGS